MTDNLEAISLHKETPKIVNAIVEIPKGTSAKYEYDSELNIFKLKRCLTPGLKYPCSYGFIPNTLAGDGDCLDILIYSDVPIERGTLVECTVIGVLDVEDQNGEDYKIIGVPTSLAECSSLDDIDTLCLKTIQNFFEHYKDREDNRWCRVNGWAPVEAAYDIIKNSQLDSDGKTTYTKNSGATNIVDFNNG
jgi:inorganic pyrophosphatase